MQNWRINCWPIYEKDSSYKCWAISLYETFLDTNGDPNMNNITTNTFGCMHQIGLTFVWVVDGLSKAAIAWLLTWVWMTVTRWWLTGDGDSADDDYREEEGVEKGDDDASDDGDHDDDDDISREWGRPRLHDGAKFGGTGWGPHVALCQSSSSVTASSPATNTFDNTQKG